MCILNTNQKVEPTVDSVVIMLCTVWAADSLNSQTTQPLAPRSALTIGGVCVMWQPAETLRPWCQICKRGLLAPPRGTMGTWQRDGTWTLAFAFFHLKSKRRDHRRARWVSPRLQFKDSWLSMHSRLLLSSQVTEGLRYSNRPRSQSLHIRLVLYYRPTGLGLKSTI